MLNSSSNSTGATARARYRLKYLIEDAEEGAYWKIDVDLLREHLAHLEDGGSLGGKDA